VIHEPKYLTTSGVRVRSWGEQEIANFLTEQGIRFRYEREIWLGYLRVRPDFYLPDYDIYIEHFGVRNLEYQRKAKVKEFLYKKQGLRLISLHYSNEGNLGAMIKLQFERITHKRFPQKKYFSWKIKNHAHAFQA
jgi:hypothetical protein